MGGDVKKDQLLLVQLVDSKRRGKWYMM